MSNPACDKWPNGGPNPTRTWTRGEGDVCSGTSESRALEKKIEVLQYKNNSAHLTKKQKWAQLAKGKSHNKKQSWATQTQTYTDPNVNNFTRTGNSLRCPCPVLEIIGNYVITNQSQAEALRGVTKITGELTITGNITDWTPFDCLKEVTYNISFEGNEIITIERFGALETVEDFSVSNNINLTTIQGFTSLKMTDGRFTIHDNSNLTTIQGFESFEKTGDDFYIFNNSNLTTIQGFGSVEMVTDAFSLYNNPKLDENNFNASFNNLKSIGLNIRVYSNLNTDWKLPSGWTTSGSQLKWGISTALRKFNNELITGLQPITNSFGGSGMPTETTNLFDLPSN